MLLVELTINDTVHYLSLEGYAGSRWWEPAIIKIDAIQRRLPRFYGGYAKLSWGDISFVPSLFENDWPPPVQCPITIKWGDSDTSAQVLFTGTCHLDRITRDEVSYEIYSENYDQDALDSATNALDRQGNPIPDAVYPIAFGMVSQKTPLRVGLATEYRYHKAGIVGTVGTDWHVYDDGVNIDSNVTDNGDGTFSLSAAPVGEVTISGTGQYQTLMDVFSWGASKLGLSLDTTFARNPSPTVGVWLSSQTKVIDFLDEIAAFYSHFFYIENGTLYLMDMFQAAGTKTLTEFDFMPSEYLQDQPVKEISARWEIQVPVTDNTGSHLKDEEHEVKLFTDYAYGNPIEIRSFHEDYDAVKAALQNILNLANRKRMRLRLPLIDLYKPGTQFTWIDTALAVPTNATLYARTIQYDFINEEVVIEGEGDITL